MPPRIDPAGVAIVASPTGATYTAARTNPALELATSLGRVNGNLPGLVNGFAAQKQASLDAQAKADALANSGEAFKEAVKSGKLKKTQNPWYIQAYEQQAAQVRGQASMSALVADAQSWAERDDPAAFATRFAQEQGALAEQFQGVDQQSGFNAAAAPLASQVLAQNVAYNASRIQQKNVQDTTTLATQSIIDLKRQNPTASAKDVFGALEAAHQKWLSVGNTEESWDEVTVGSIAAAAYSLGDPSLLDTLKDDRGGKGALYNTVDKNGKPAAEEIETFRFRIEQAVSNAGMAEVKARAAKVASEGSAAYQSVWDKNGTAFIEGQLSKAELVTQMKDAGYTPQAIQYALKKFAEDAAANNSLANALMGGDPEAFDLYTMANRDGFTPELHARVAEKVRLGELTLNEAEQIISAGTSRSNHFSSEARADARQAKSDARAAITAGKALTTAQAKSLKDARGNTAGVVATALARVGDKTLAGGKGRTAFDKALKDAEGAHLASHPGDYNGARTVVDAYANQYLQSRLASRQPRRPKPSSSGSSNPRGN